jgi:hypothetical protein
LTRSKNTRRLLSYFHTKDKTKKEFRVYCKTGRNNK